MHPRSIPIVVSPWWYAHVALGRPRTAVFCMADCMFFGFGGKPRKARRSPLSSRDGLIMVCKLYQFPSLLAAGTAVLAPAAQLSCPGPTAHSPALSRTSDPLALSRACSPSCTGGRACRAPRMCIFFTLKMLGDLGSHCHAAARAGPLQPRSPGHLLLA
jgi:hypothetical protein